MLTATHCHTLLLPCGLRHTSHIQLPPTLANLTDAPETQSLSSRNKTYKHTNRTRRVCLFSLQLYYLYLNFISLFFYPVNHIGWGLCLAPRYGLFLPTHPWLFYRNLGMSYPVPPNDRSIDDDGHGLYGNELIYNILI